MTATQADPKDTPAKEPAPSPWAAARLLREAATGEGPQLRQAMLWLCLAAGVEAAGPILGKHFIDHFLVPGRYEVMAMAGLLAVMLLTGWAASWVRYGQLTRLAGLARRSVLRLRERVYAHVLALPMSFFDKAITGQLVSRVTNDTESVNTLYRQVLFVMLDSTIVVLGAVAAMAWLDWQLMLIVLMLVPAMVVIVWAYQRWSGPAVTRQRELRSDINARMAESVAGMSVLQAAGAAPRFADAFGHTNQDHWLSRIDDLRANAWLLRPALDLLNTLLLVAVIWGFGLRELSGLEIGLLYAFLSFIARVVDPLIQITLQFGQLQQSMIAASRVRTLLLEAEDLHQERDDAPLASGRIELSGVRFGYDPARPVLQDLSVRIGSGEFIGIVGHTGSGKSTLLSLLLKFYAPQQGQILLDGRLLEGITPARFHEAVGLVPQEPYLVAGTVRENLVMGRPISEEAMLAAAKAARIHDFVMGLPQGYDTLLGEGGAKVSTGQRQLIAMARALAAQPQVLFLDEATANIDSGTEQVVQQALEALRGRVTILAIAHRLSTIRRADQILVLNHGQLVEQGQHEQLMAIEGGLYQRLVQLQDLSRMVEADEADAAVQALDTETAGSTRQALSA